MYGLINKAVEGLVRSKFGDSAWERIRSGAGLPDQPFISMEQYPDATTYALVEAASRELGAEPEAILQEFGRYWTRYTAEAGFGALLHGVGRTLLEFLRNLDQMHTRVQLAFSRLEPPSFTVTDERADSLMLHYYSTRPGLAPVVVGMLEGLGDRFDLQLEIRHERVQAPTPHDTFRVSWRPGTEVMA